MMLKTWMATLSLIYEGYHMLVQLALIAVANLMWQTCFDMKSSASSSFAQK